VALTTTQFAACDFQFEYRYHAPIKNANCLVEFREVGLDFKTPKVGLGPWVDVKYSFKPTDTAGGVPALYFRVQGGQSDWVGPFLVVSKHEASPLKISAGFRSKMSVRNVKIKPLGLKSIFNGKNLDGWKKFTGDKKREKSEFTVTKEGWLNLKTGPGDLQT